MLLPDQSNAVTYYITSAFSFSSIIQKGKLRRKKKGRERDGEADYLKQSPESFSSLSSA